MNQPTYPTSSCEEILGVLCTSGSPLSVTDTAKALSVTRKEHDDFIERLTVMERDGQIEFNRKGYYELVHQPNSIEDRVIGHRDDFGFFVRDDGEPDIFLPEREMQKAMHGDRALVCTAGYDRRGHSEGQVVEILQRANKRVIGRLLPESDTFIVTPEDKRLGCDILIAPEGQGKAKAGQAVSVEILEYPDRYVQPIGRVVGVLGEIDDPGMEIEIAVRKYGVPHEFSEPAQREAEALPDVVHDAGLAGRIDLRDVPSITIDGEDACDFDDAVYAKPVKIGRTKGWRLTAATADVSHYVRPGHPLDVDATDRTTSVYFPRRVIPMLPEKLSNGLCSLNPEMDRLYMVCDAVTTARGEIKAYQFYPAVVYSKARLTHNEAWAILPNVKGSKAAKRAPLVSHLQDLYELCQTLLRARRERGAIDFDTIETCTVCNVQGKIEQILPRARNDAHRLIEECMLTASVCVAEMLEKYRHPVLYRVHAGPTEEKPQALRAFLKTSGLTLGDGDKPQVVDHAELIERVAVRPDVPMLQIMLLHSMQQTVCNPDNIGHFGLAYPAYAHSTSPIRCYPNLLVHRPIKVILHHTRCVPALAPGVQLNSALSLKTRCLQAEAEKGIPAAVVNKAKVEAIWHELGVHCSADERHVDEVSCDVEAWFKCYFIRDKPGNEFSGIVSAVTSSGISVQLDKLYVESLVHVIELGSDYFQYDEVRNELRGERTGIRYRLTDRVRVQLLRVDLDAREMDFRLIQEPPIKALRPAKVTDAPEASVTCQPVGATPAPLAGRKKPRQLAVLSDGTARPEELFDEMLDCVIEEQPVFEPDSRVLPPGYAHVKSARKKQTARGTKPKGGAKTAVPRKVVGRIPRKTKGC